MSDMQSPSYSPTQATSKRVSPVLVWLLVLVVAGGAFAGAVMWAGGISEIEKMTGLSGGFSGLLGMFGGGEASAVVGAKRVASKSTTSTAGGSVLVSSLPDFAQRRMYQEQIESQPAIQEVLGGSMTSYAISPAQINGDTAVVPLAAKYKDGSTLSGAITLRQFEGKWYFYSITRFANDPEPKVGNAGFDSKVVAVITQQQATPVVQESIADGLLSGGFSVVDVTGIDRGAGTATVKVNLTGGREGDAPARFVLIKKMDGSTPYWFVAKFEKQ